MPPIPEEQPLTSNEFLSGFQAAYTAAYLAGWEQATTWGRAARSRCNKATGPTAEGHVLTARKRMSQTIAMMATIRSRRRGSTSHWAFFFKQWLEQYNMDNPVNLNEYPRVEFWTDTKWEPYKEDIQQVIRSHLTKYGQDLREKLEITIDLDEGNK